MGARTRRGFGGLRIIGAHSAASGSELPLPEPWNNPGSLLTPPLSHYEALQALWPGPANVGDLMEATLATGSVSGVLGEPSADLRAQLAGGRSVASRPSSRCNHRRLAPRVPSAGGMTCGRRPRDRMITSGQNDLFCVGIAIMLYGR